jgi:hypothetical protein
VILLTRARLADTYRWAQTPRAIVGISSLPQTPSHIPGIVHRDIVSSVSAAMVRRERYDLPTPAGQLFPKQTWGDGGLSAIVTHSPLLVEDENSRVAGCLWRVQCSR